MKWYYCDRCEAIVRRRLHGFWHAIILYLAIKTEEEWRRIDELLRKDE